MPKIRQMIMTRYKNCRAFARDMTDKYGKGWDEGMISRLACGRCWPTLESLNRICKELECQPSDLYGVDELKEMIELGTTGLVWLGRKQEQKDEEAREEASLDAGREEEHHGHGPDAGKAVRGVDGAGGHQQGTPDERGDHRMVPAQLGDAPVDDPQEEISHMGDSRVDGIMDEIYREAE